MSLIETMAKVERMAKLGYAPEDINLPGISPKTVSAIVAVARQSPRVSERVARKNEAAHEHEIRQAQLEEIQRKSRKAREDACIQLADAIRSDDEPRASEILRLIAAREGITVRELLARGGRHDGPVAFRFEAMFLVAKYTSLSSSAIGRLMRRDHSTVLHGILTYAERNGLPYPRGMRRSPKIQSRRAVRG